MFFRSERRQMRSGISLLIFALAIALTPQSLKAQAPSTEQLIRGLQCRQDQDCQSQPQGQTRAWGAANNRNFTFEPATEEGRTEIEKRVNEGKLPSADLEVYFQYDSAELLPEARHLLDALGRALTDHRLAGNRFVLIGHTDGKGSDAYNQTLSERRAAAARNYLIDKFQLDRQSLVAYGRGKTALKFPSDPLEARNRRVQVVNAGR